jgi:MFS family permease
MHRLFAAIRQLRPTLLWILPVVFLADACVGYLLPLLPRRATELGASLALVGLLAAANGLTQVAAAVPVGAWSDRNGRRRVIALGLLCFVSGALLLSTVTTPVPLVFIQVLMGLGIVATFQQASAYVGDHSTLAQRGLAVGLLTTAMGLGFAVGPLLGGWIAVNSGLAASLWFVAAIAGCGAAVAWWRLPRTVNAAGVRVGIPRRGFAILSGNRLLVTAALANILFNMVFSGIIINFVPIKAGTLGFGALAISSLFTARALASTLARLPAGLASSPRTSHWLMVAAMTCAGSALLLIVAFQSYPAFLGALILEGVSYGTFLTAGQAFVIQHAAAESRGATLGAYNMAGALSTALSPLLVGAFSQWLGLDVVLAGVGVVILGGAALVGARFAREIATPALEPADG